MRLLILIFTFFTLGFANQYTFLVNKYNNEIELEAKILSKIATDSTKEPITLFIPQITPEEEKIYSKFFTLTTNCEEANFVFINKDLAPDTLTCNIQ